MGGIGSNCSAGGVDGTVVSGLHTPLPEGGMLSDGCCLTICVDVDHDRC